MTRSQSITTQNNRPVRQMTKRDVFLGKLQLMAHVFTDLGWENGRTPTGICWRVKFLKWLNQTTFFKLQAVAVNFLLFREKSITFGSIRRGHTSGFPRGIRKSWWTTARCWWVFCARRRALGPSPTFLMDIVFKDLGHQVAAVNFSTTSKRIEGKINLLSSVYRTWKWKTFHSAMGRCLISSIMAPRQEDPTQFCWQLWRTRRPIRQIPEDSAAKLELVWKVWRWRLLEQITNIFYVAFHFA